MRLVVTTCLGNTSAIDERAQVLSRQLELSFVKRDKMSIKQLLQHYDGLVLVYQSELRFVHSSGSVLAFHPDTAMLRIKAPRDPLLEILGESPKTVLDITMGLCSDSIVMSYAGHQVTALESQKIPYLIVADGLKHFETQNRRLSQAMKSIRPIHVDHLDFLRQQAEKSFDIVYMDPMFSESISESQNLAGLTPLANPQSLKKEVVREARRVARDKVILKAHFRDTAFEKYGFKRMVRPNQKFHFGVIDLNEYKK